MLRRLLLSIVCLCTLSLAISAYAQVQTLPFNPQAIPSALKMKGKIENGLRWIDRAGENYLLFSTVTKEKSDLSSIYLYATHYLVKSDQVKVVRTLKDREESCEFNNNAGFDKKSFGVTDLDKNGLGETTFIYTLGCTNDPSPNDAKLALLEHGKKYMIRGEATVIFPGGMKVGGTYKVDPLLLKAPNVFLEHALSRWKALTISEF